MNKTWFTSDNHFSHRNIHKFCPATRPHSDITEMDEAMIKRWNEQVSADDTVWLLGDVFFCQESQAIKIMRRLAGHKHLVFGNHDKVIRESKHLQSMFESVHEYKELNMPTATGGKGAKVCLFHYPIQEWNKIHHGAYHFHGHIHERMADVPGRILNVCIDSPTFGDGTYSLYEWDMLARVAESRPVRSHGKGKVEL